MSDRKKIFITEDEFIVSKNLESKLSGLGYEVTGTSPTGEMAIQMIRKNPPDIVLMDIMLAGEMDGIEAAKKIRAELDIPVIFLTAYSSEEIYKRAALAEPYAYIIKPYEERELEINIAIALYKNNIEREYARKQIELEEINNKLDQLVEERTAHLLKEIEERRKAEELQQRFYNVIEQSSDHVIITNVRGEIEYVNQAICEFTGFDRDEMLNSSPSILKSGMYEEDFYATLWDTILAGNEFSEEFVNKKKNGELYSVAQVILPLKNNRKEITHFASISRHFADKKNFEKKMVSVQEDERSRISRELHDGIGQTIAALKLCINQMKTNQPPSQDQLDNMQHLLEGLSSTIREISFDLMPSILSDYGVVVALNRVFNDVEKNSNLDIYFNHGDDKIRLPRDVELAVFRIVQEALSNTLKYGKAKIFEVKLNCKKNAVDLMIADNGQGFDLNEALRVDGQGLRNMKHRTQILNGVYRIESDYNKGTRINIRIPIDKDGTC